MIDKPFPCTIIFGPTAVGKTDVALALAERVGGTIINADVGQFYAPLSIGTAKPPVAHPTVPHYMFDYCTTPRDVTVVEYRHALEKIVSKNPPYPIVVGGSGFYVSSLFFPPMEQDDKGRHGELVHERSWQQLHAVDPARAAQIHPHDVYRIERALALFAKTGNKPSTYVPQYRPIAQEIHFIILDRERDDLYARIEARVTKMFEQGWLEEVDAVLAQPGWREFLLRKKLLGYPEIITALEKGNGDDQQKPLRECIAQKTRNYAKRQRSFGRMLARKLTPCEGNSLTVHTVNLTLLDLDLYINKQAAMLMHTKTN